MTALALPGKKSQATDEITGILRRRRGDAFNKPDSFGISSAEAISNQFRSIMGSIALLTIAVASVGMLVGGVGVMNIMLMSVTERTHEIGVRKAIGARSKDVVRQFLVEAMVLTGSAGVAAVLFCLALIAVLNVVLPQVAHGGSGMGDSGIGGGGDERGTVLRNLSGGQGGKAGPGGSAALRVARQGGAPG